MPPVAPITDWGTAIVTSLASALMLFVDAIPKIIGFIVILILGWIIASIIATAVAALLRAVRFNDLAKRAGLSDFVHKMGIAKDASGALADIAKWFIRLITLVVAFDALGLPAVSQVLNSMLLWLPNLAVALVVLVITGLIANLAADLVRGSTAEAGLGNPNVLSNLAKIAIWGFGIIVAVNQIGIASILVDTLFIGFVAALALAFGLAFGLGSRDTAGQLVQSWYNNAQYAGPKLRRASDAAQRQAMGLGNGGSRGPSGQNQPESERRNQ